MAQHDYEIANQSGAAFRQDLNVALAAVATNNSADAGGAQPSTTFRYQWWADNGNGLLKIRNAANNDWITIGTLADTNLGLLSQGGGTLTGALLADDAGTAALPAIAFDGDTDTGIFRAGANQLNIATNGVERVEFGTTEVVFNDGGADVDFRVEGDTNPDLFKIDAGTDQVQVANLNGGPLAGLRNRIINGDFDLWQRGVGPFTLNNYGVDRWIHARLGTTQSVSRQSFTLGQTAVPNEPTYFCRTAVTSVTGASNYAILIQHIEDVRSFAGQQVTLSFWAKADATKSISVELSQSFGTGGSPSATVDAIGVTKVSIGTSWQKITVTTTLPSISGKTLGTDGNHWLSAGIWFDAGSNYNSRTATLGHQSGTFDIAQVQLEPGPVATPFEHRSQSQELALCQRYFRTVTFAGGGYSGVDVGYFSIEGMEDMITRPTFTPSANYAFQWYNGTAGSWTATTTGIVFSLPTLVGGERLLLATGLTGNVATISTPCAGVFYGQLDAEI